MFLRNFLETAEQYFFVGFKVHIYVFTDRPKEVPQVKMAAGRQVNCKWKGMVKNKSPAHSPDKE